MTSKIISFQISPGFKGHNKTYSPEVIALCKDGSLWTIDLYDFHNNYSCWKCLAPAPETINGNIKPTPTPTSGHMR